MSPAGLSQVPLKLQVGVAGIWSSGSWKVEEASWRNSLPQQGTMSAGGTPGQE